jgi:hypothetical protein
MKMENQAKLRFAFRCYAYPATNAERRGYYAICIDLNLYTWRPTMEEAQESLNDAILGYFETVIELARDEELTYEQLAKRILRPAPFFPHRARYYAQRLRDSLSRDGRTTYKNPVYVPMAGATA